MRGLKRSTENGYEIFEITGTLPIPRFMAVVKNVSEANGQIVFVVKYQFEDLIEEIGLFYAKKFKYPDKPEDNMMHRLMGKVLLDNLIPDTYFVKEIEKKRILEIKPEKEKINE